MKKEEEEKRKYRVSPGPGKNGGIVDKRGSPQVERDEDVDLLGDNYLFRTKTTKPNPTSALPRAVLLSQT